MHFCKIFSFHIHNIYFAATVCRCFQLFSCIISFCRCMSLEWISRGYWLNMEPHDAEKYYLFTWDLGLAKCVLGFPACGAKLFSILFILNMIYLFFCWLSSHMMLIWFVARDSSGIDIYIICSTFYIFGSCLFSDFGISILWIWIRLYGISGYLSLT